jgi:hypothetical protein
MTRRTIRFHECGPDGAASDSELEADIIDLTDGLPFNPIQVGDRVVIDLTV